jgi:hypothetical protein
MVLVAAAFMFAAIAIKRQALPDPYRFAWAAGLITLGLSVLADTVPEVAGPAAILILMAVYWRNRGVLGSVLPQSHTAATASSPAASRPTQVH